MGSGHLGGFGVVPLRQVDHLAGTARHAGKERSGAIQAGAALKKTPVKRREKPPENALLAAIKRGGALRKVDVATTKAEAKPKSGLFGNEVDKILALRAKIGAESDSSSDSSDDWDSDDS